ncbi:MAG: response regulator [Candidatus Saganbacteria bacterium]|nr:response regulator [Candidatus Saganbacteria bacterium]
MHSKKVLLLTADSQARGQIDAVLSMHYHLKSTAMEEEALHVFDEFHPELLILDQYLEPDNGLEVFKKFKRSNPFVKAVLIVSPADIEVAVTAAKLGIANVVRKPIEQAAFLQVVEEVLSQSLVSSFVGYSMVKDTEWLDGVGEERSRLLAELAQVSKSMKDVILIGGKGINAGKVAEVIHANSIKGDRKLIALDLASFQNESSEGHFWVMIRELLMEQEEISDRTKDLCGTLLLDAFGCIEPHFQASILEFLKEEKMIKKRGKIDQGIKIIISLPNRETLSVFSPEILGNFMVLELPRLVDRKEDLPVLISDLVFKFNAKYGKAVKGVSLEVLEFLVYYPFPGNYAELENLIENAVLLTESEIIALKDLPLNLQAFLLSNLNASLEKDVKKLEKVFTGLNKNLYALLLEKSDWDEARVARFLDLPTEAFTAKLKEVGLL